MKRRRIDRLHRRKRWRTELADEARRMLTTPYGNSDEFKGKVKRAHDKVHAWFGKRADLVINAIQRRVIRGAHE